MTPQSKDGRDLRDKLDDLIREIPESKSTSMDGNDRRQFPWSREHAQWLFNAMLMMIEERSTVCSAGLEEEHIQAIKKLTPVSEDIVDTVSERKKIKTAIGAVIVLVLTGIANSFFDILDKKTWVALFERVFHQ